MKVFKFTLQGKTAFFKKPEVNSYLYFSYGHIHRVALLGIFGAIRGYNGYNQMGKNEIYPEFYEKLKELKIAIVPLNRNGIINKKVNVFNNSVGYASKEQGGNLIVKEQWLENPKWEIYFLLDSEEAEKLAHNIMNREFIYVPYLGKNDHFAELSDFEVIEGGIAKDFNLIDSFFKKNNYQLVMEEEDDFSFDEVEEKIIYKYEEKFPVELDKETNQYILENLVFTNNNIEIKNQGLVYKVKDKIIEFI